MKLLGPSHAAVDPQRRGAALLLSFLVLMVIVAVVYQLNRSTSIDQQVAHKDVILARMDLAIESAFLEVAEQLLSDAELKQAGEEEGAGGAEEEALGDLGGGGGMGEGEGSNPDSVDSQMDEWAQVAATSFDDIQLRIYIEDEERKYNILNMLNDDEELADDAFDRVVRILDLCREGTDADISYTDAEDLARVMREHMLQRDTSALPRPAELLSDSEEYTSLGLPLTLREFVALPPFTEGLFRDYFDRDENRVHSIGSFLTVYTSPATGEDEGEAESGAGWSVNVNTAPLAVLAGLMDSRDMSIRTWDWVLDYRNQEEELPDSEDDSEPMLDEFGEEVIQKQIFDDIEELAEVPDWDGLSPEIREEVESLLRVESDVFSVFVTARYITASDKNQVYEFDSRVEQEKYERSGSHLVRTARCVLWRTDGDDGGEILPLLRWELLDYAPLPVLDYPDDDWRRR